MRAVVVVLLLCGCGRLSFDAHGDAGADRDASKDASNDAGVTGRCNELGGVYDTFDGVAYDMDLWAGTYQDPGTSLVVSGGEVIVTPATNSAMTYAGLVSYRHYDLHNNRLVAEITQTAADAVSSGILLSTGSNRLTLEHGVGNSLVASYAVPVYAQLGVIPYVPVDHRFWAISEAGGTISWETSPDGATFTPFTQLAAPFDVSFVRIHVFAGTNGPVSTPGSYHVTSVGAPTGSRPACGADTFNDAYERPSLGASWANSLAEACCTFSLSNGQLVMTTDGSLGHTFVRSAAGYDLRDQDVDVELVQAAAQAVIEQSLVVRRDPLDSVAIVLAGGMFDVNEVIAGTAASHMIAQNAGEKFLRIREAGGVYTAEVSVDRLAWRLLRSAAVPFGFDNVTFELQAGQTGSSVGADTVIWDNFNTP